MLWVKSFHLIFMVTWFAGLFYLPRLFVYHTMSDDRISLDRFKIMERKLFYGIMTPGAILTIIFGAWLWMGYGLGGNWLKVKLILILVLIIYHVYLGKLMLDFKNEKNSHGHVFYRWLNEFPVILIIPIILLAVIKPWS